jgi:hypothetical protein
VADRKPGAGSRFMTQFNHYHQAGLPAHPALRLTFVMQCPFTIHGMLAILRISCRGLGAPANLMRFSEKKHLFDNPPLVFA